MDNVLHQHSWKRAAALTALFAILLIVVAPLISVSLQKDPMSAMPGMHHDMSMMSVDEHHGDMTHSMPVDHAEACGYCVLLAHVPGVMLALIVLLSVVLQRLRVKPPRQAVSHWHFFPPALPRYPRAAASVCFLPLKQNHSLFALKRKSMTTCTPRAAWGNLLRRLHFYIGLFVGPFIFFAALTGTLYVATPQLENALYHYALHTDAVGEAQPLAEQIAVAEKAVGSALRLHAVRPGLEEGETTRVMFADPALGPSEHRAIFIDPASLEVRGDMTVYGTSGILPLRQTIDYLHTSLMLGNIGRLYSELAASWMWVAALGRDRVVVLHPTEAPY